MHCRRLFKPLATPLILFAVCAMLVLYMNNSSPSTAKKQHVLVPRKVPESTTETLKTFQTTIPIMKTPLHKPTKTPLKDTVSPEFVKRLHKLHSKVFDPKKIERLKKEKEAKVETDKLKACLRNTKYCNETVLILTPIRNAARYLEHYIQLIKSLNYPHHLLSVALGEDSSTDNTKELAESVLKNLTGFHRAELYVTGKSISLPLTWKDIHKKENQLTRRGHMAESRNNLLFQAIEREQWVLWVDCDVKSFPPNVIQGLLSARKDIVVPSCLYVTSEGKQDVYDRNTWRETNESLQHLAYAPKDFLALEGYGVSSRLYLPQLKDKGEVVEIDGVGGCVLLINAACHKKGLVFPNFVFDHHIETEGLAKMAKAMGIQPYGMPYIEVFHL